MDDHHLARGRRRFVDHDRLRLFDNDFLGRRRINWPGSCDNDFRALPDMLVAMMAADRQTRTGKQCHDHADRKSMAHETFSFAP
jgi:hypothetical protein